MTSYNYSQYIQVSDVEIINTSFITSIQLSDTVVKFNLHGHTYPATVEYATVNEAREAYNKFIERLVYNE